MSGADFFLSLSSVHVERLTKMIKAELATNLNVKWTLSIVFFIVFLFTTSYPIEGCYRMISFTLCFVLSCYKRQCQLRLNHIDCNKIQLICDTRLGFQINGQIEFIRSNYYDVGQKITAT